MGEKKRILIIDDDPDIVTFLTALLEDNGYTAFSAADKTPASVITSVLTVAACLLVVRDHGVLGVASAVCVGVIVQNLAMWLGTRYLTGLWTHVGLPRGRDIRALFE